MAATTLQAADEKMIAQLTTFLKVGEERGVFTSPGGKTLRTDLSGWLPKFRGAIDPSFVSDLHKTKIAPFLAVFSKSHDMVAALSLLFQGHARARGNEVEVEGLTGPLLVGADELEDEQKLRAWPPIFIKLFGAAALPWELQHDAVKKQLTAHAAAREALPGTTDGQVYRAAQSNKKTLRTEGVGYWERMHGLLDGEFGTGTEAFATKAEFGYERRLRGAGASRKKRVGEVPPAGAGASGSGGTNSAGGNSAVAGSAAPEAKAAAATVA
jgi:hypothetical protein